MSAENKGPVYLFLEKTELQLPPDYGNAENMNVNKY
jgi:hypothetical protein